MNRLLGRLDRTSIGFELGFYVLCAIGLGALMIVVIKAAQKLNTPQAAKTSPLPDITKKFEDELKASEDRVAAGTQAQPFAQPTQAPNLAQAPQQPYQPAYNSTPAPMSTPNYTYSRNDQLVPMRFPTSITLNLPPP